jgi:single-stranded-DNA-specific exonuclease
MKKPQRHWTVPDRDAAPLALPGRTLLVRRVLAARGFHDAGEVARFFGTDLVDAPDPFQLTGMKAAVDLLEDALRAGRRIAIYGDYDADGITATAILARALRACGAEVITYIPNRFTEGYGVHGAALAELHRQGADVVVTCDCGTNSVEALSTRPAGLRVIVADHHEPVGRLAPADALINPKQPGCAYPFQGLAACGVAYKLLSALRSRFPELAPEAQLELVAIGTVADMVPLVGENRAMVAAGLTQLSTAPTPGVAALLRVAGVRPPCTSEHLAYAVGPRLNAAGRMQDAQLALDLLLSPDPEQAERLATELNTQNVSRQAATLTAVGEARERALALPDDDPVIVVADAAWPQGIVGLAASKLVEEFQRPALVLSIDGEEARGSARSVEGFHMVDCLRAVAPLLTRFGGHAMAAGFSLPVQRLDELRAAVRDWAMTRLEPPTKLLAVDAVLSLGDLGPPAYRDLQTLAPFGLDNRQPLLMAEGVRVLSAETFGSDRRHLRVRFQDDTGLQEAIAFDRAPLLAHLPAQRQVDVLFTLGLDAWNGLEKTRLELRDMRPSRVGALTRA